jgi:DNA repair exonuclease SbcCD ATPase subunit
VTNRRNWTNLFQQASEQVSRWRQQNPRANFTEIENTVDEQLAQIRAAMIQELALESELTDFKQLPDEKRPPCPSCGRPLASNGQQKRKLVTTYEQEVALVRSKGYCRHCRVSYFPPG